MKRHLIAATAALSLALSGLTAGPVAAKDRKSDDLVKLLLGAAAVGLILNEMNGGRLFQPNRARTAPDPYVPPFGREPERLIPGECAMDVKINGRWREVISERCVREFGLSRRLPAECAFDIRAEAGVRRVYGPQCLGDHGYRVATIRY